jgi:hypothetical protein
MRSVLTYGIDTFQPDAWAQRIRALAHPTAAEIGIYFDQDSHDGALEPCRSCAACKSIYIVQNLAQILSDHAW